MRARAVSGDLHIQAIAGSGVVLLGFDYPRAQMAGVHGFGIERLDHTEGGQRWLSNQLRFDGATTWTTKDNPVQSFAWNDYRVKAAHTYTYIVHVMEGQPSTALTSRVEASVTVTSEHPDEHGVWFNRGVIGSQAYAERFKNKPPDQVPNREAWKWLSRGLEEALLAFIGQAIDQHWELHGSFYEFRQPEVLAAFATAKRAGAGVDLIVDGTQAGNHDSVTTAGIEDCIALWRMHAVIPHNKFLVASKDGQPTAVWTGSTNITPSGIFGQSNVGHATQDPAIAAQYLSYWTELLNDPARSTLADWVDLANPIPANWPAGTSVVFSPHRQPTALARWGDLFGAGQEMVCATFPFNLDATFLNQLGGNHDALRWLLFESTASADTARAAITDPKTRVAAGSYVHGGELNGWLTELKDPLGKKVHFIHTKYLIVDPLGPDPIVVTGSANFSKPSADHNDENMLVIRGNPAVADIYLTEFQRMFQHYAFRDSLHLNQNQPSPGPELGFDAPHGHGLDPTDGWWPKYFDEPARARQRVLFAGTAPPA